MRVVAAFSSRSRVSLLKVSLGTGVSIPSVITEVVDFTPIASIWVSSASSLVLVDMTYMLYNNLHTNFDT